MNGVGTQSINWNYLGDDNERRGDGAAGLQDAGQVGLWSNQVGETI